MMDKVYSAWKRFWSFFGIGSGLTLEELTLDDVPADGLIHLSSAFEEFGDDELIRTTRRVLLEAAESKRKEKKLQTLVVGSRTQSSRFRTLAFVFLVLIFGLGLAWAAYQVVVTKKLSPPPKRKQPLKHHDGSKLNNYLLGPGTRASTRVPKYNNCNFPHDVQIRFLSNEILFSRLRHCESSKVKKKVALELIVRIKNVPFSKIPPLFSHNDWRVKAWAGLLVYFYPMTKKRGAFMHKIVHLFRKKYNSFSNPLVRSAMLFALSKYWRTTPSFQLLSGVCHWRHFGLEMISSIGGLYNYFAKSRVLRVLRANKLKDAIQMFEWLASQYVYANPRRFYTISYVKCSEPFLKHDELSALLLSWLNSNDEETRFFGLYLSELVTSQPITLISFPRRIILHTKTWYLRNRKRWPILHKIGSDEVVTYHSPKILLKDSDFSPAQLNRLISALISPVKGEGIDVRYMRIRAIKSFLMWYFDPIAIYPMRKSSFRLARSLIDTLKDLCGASSGLRRVCVSSYEDLFFLGMNKIISYEKRMHFEKLQGYLSKSLEFLYSKDVEFFPSLLSSYRRCEVHHPSLDDFCHCFIKSSRKGKLRKQGFTYLERGSFTLNPAHHFLHTLFSEADIPQLKLIANRRAQNKKHLFRRLYAEIRAQSKMKKKRKDLLDTCGVPSIEKVFLKNKRGPYPYFFSFRIVVKGRCLPPDLYIFVESCSHSGRQFRYFSTLILDPVYSCWTNKNELKTVKGFVKIKSEIRVLFHFNISLQE